MTGTSNTSNNPRVKVPGYAKRELFGNGIEYRNFSPDLVGLQLASEGGTPLFTMGNFSITTNMEPKVTKDFITNQFSNFISLTDLDLSLAQANLLLRNNAGVLLNLDKNNLKYNAQFGSLNEFVRISLEDIITNWPASLYVTKTIIDANGDVIYGNTYENYSYDALTDISSFKVKTTFINNNFQINFNKNGSILDTFNASNDLRNLTVNYESYVVLINNEEYAVKGFTGSTYPTNDYIYLTVKGNPFTGTASTLIYHIKPNKLKEETFFNSLPDFEAYLLNRLVTPKYTASFKYSVKSDEGSNLFITDSITWPTTDGYNIDFDTDDYIIYASNLLELSTNNDLATSDLMHRYLVSDSISSFDTAPVNIDYLDRDTTGQKITKTLRIYGKNYDDINNFIDGISFANVVTYDKQDNIPDIYIKNLARVLGWELISSVIENGLLASYVTTSESTYAGFSVGLTPVEADIELWRRLILNSPWLWKSKGARKSIEFLLKFIGVPIGLIKFNEYVYKTEAPLDIDLFEKVLALNNLDNTDLTIYPIDRDGYPTPMADTPSMYYQNYGLWFRETGGQDSTHDILTGNNPHLGPYDGGFAYINQFKKLIPNFSAVTLTSSTIVTGTTKLFTNYDIGQITNYSGQTYVDAIYDTGMAIKDCVVVTSFVSPDPMPQDITNECGCSPASEDDALSICIKINKYVTPPLCEKMAYPPNDTNFGYSNYTYYTYDINGSIIKDTSNNPVTISSIFATKECCVANNGLPTIYSTVSDNVVINTGYVCCKKDVKCGCNVACDWLPVFQPILLPIGNPQQIQYLEYIKKDGSHGVTTPDGTHCLTGGLAYTTAIPNVTDPYTGEVGFACKLNQSGLDDLLLGQNGVMYNHMFNKKNGNVGCCMPIRFR